MRFSNGFDMVWLPRHWSLHQLNVSCYYVLHSDWLMMQVSIQISTQRQQLNNENKQIPIAHTPCNDLMNNSSTELQTTNVLT